MAPTPGPWKDNGQRTWEDSGIFGPDGQLVCGVACEYFICEPDDARLIVAAPELRDALAEILDFIRFEMAAEASQAWRASIRYQKAEAALRKAGVA